jgi:hypothetical protein
VCARTHQNLRRFVLGWRWLPRERPMMWIVLEILQPSKRRIFHMAQVSLILSKVQKLLLSYNLKMVLVVSILLTQFVHLDDGGVFTLYYTLRYCVHIIGGANDISY